MSSESPKTPEVKGFEGPEEIKAAAREHMQKERGLMERLGAKQKRFMRTAVAMTVLAGASACSESNETDASHSPTHAVESDTRERIEARREHRQEKRDAEKEYYETIEERAQEFAKEMGVAYKDHRALSDIVTSVNGTPVPPELYTEKEREQLEFVRAMRDIEREQRSDTRSKERSKTDPSTHLESMEVDTDVY